MARDFQELGFDIIATKGTADLLSENGISTRSIFKVGEGRPNVVDAIKNGEVQLVINTCPLYNSPSPRDATLPRMPSSA